MKDRKKGEKRRGGRREKKIKRRKKIKSLPGDLQFDRVGPTTVVHLSGAIALYHSDWMRPAGQTQKKPLTQEKDQILYWNQYGLWGSFSSSSYSFSSSYSLVICLCTIFGAIVIVRLSFDRSLPDWICGKWLMWSWIRNGNGEEILRGMWGFLKDGKDRSQTVGWWFQRFNVPMARLDWLNLAKIVV